MLLLVKNFILIFTLSLYDSGNADTGKKLYSSMYNFVLDLKNISDNMLKFAAKVQAVFCPDLPVCNNDGTWQDGTDTLDVLPPYMSVGISTVKLEDTNDIVGICCLPCSCSDDCQENNNCCPSKLHFGSEARAIEPVKSDCIVPISDSYSNKDSGISGYFMTTKCFIDQSNSTLVQACKHPSAYKLAETVPVTSLKTGRTYWNRYCALCNNDADGIMKWSSSVTLPADRSLIFFGNHSTRFLYPETFEELHLLISRQAGIHYSPPFSLPYGKCIRNEYLKSSCHMAASDDIFNDDTFRMQKCKKFHDLVVFTNELGRQDTFTDIFCLFCRYTELQPMEKPDCEFEKGSRGAVSTKQMTAILDYDSDRNSERGPAIIHKKNICPCNEVYDNFLGSCRSVFCPVGEFLKGCHCKQPLQNVSGMPILLKLRVATKTNQVNKMAMAQMNKYHTALENMLQKTVKDITVETVATFKQEAKNGEHYLSMTIARSNPGHDTMKTMKPFLDYLDSEKEIEFKAGNVEYISKVTDRILLWNTYDVDTKTQEMLAKDLDKDSFGLDPIAIFADATFIQVHLKHGFYQPLSPLLYCMQVKLDASEYVEEDYRVVVKTATPVISVPYYYKIGGINQVVRICVDQYLPKHENRGTCSGRKATIWLITLIYLAPRLYNFFHAQLT